MSEPEAYRPTVRTQSDLERVWRHLVAPLDLRGHSIWLMRVARDGRAVPHLLEVTEARSVPTGPAHAAAFGLLLADLEADDPGGSFAFLRSRPGRGVDATDRGWAGFLYAAGRHAGVRVEVVHLATDAGVVPLPLDEVGLPCRA